MFFTSVWCYGDEEEFKKSVPLELLGESIKKYNSKIPFVLVFLEGLQYLSNDYLNRLKLFGFSIIDYSGKYKEVVNEFENISNFYIQYERNCFLRWIVFSRILKDNFSNVSQIWHLDSDVVLNVSLDSIANETKDKTFMLQGCPVLVSISDFDWFEIYERELKLFNNDIIQYSIEAFRIKENIKVNDIEFCNQTLYGCPIGNDQGFLEYLISSRIIMQEKSVDLYNSQFYYIQNILSINYWHSYQSSTDEKFNLVGGDKIRIDNKNVPFIHYQNNFISYAAVYITLSKWYIPKLLKRKILSYEVIEDQFKATNTFKIILKGLSILGLTKRLKVMNKMQQNYNYLIDMLNFSINKLL